MDLAYLSPAWHTNGAFDVFDIQKDCSVLIGSRMIDESVEGGVGYGKNSKLRRRRKYGSRIRERNKKTHLRQFNNRQKKCKRPKPVPEMFLSGANLVRFGAFCGIRDSRATRCPLRGISHGIHLKSGRRCACRSFTLYPSPLISVAKVMLDPDFGSLFNMMDNNRASIGPFLNS